MFIKRDEYDRLRKLEPENAALREQSQGMAELITAKTTDCQLGPWCRECVHHGVDAAGVPTHVGHGRYIDRYENRVHYCKKHIHEMCPEFEGG